MFAMAGSLGHGNIAALREGGPGPILNLASNFAYMTLKLDVLKL